MKLLQTFTLLFISHTIFSQAGTLDMTFGEEGIVLTDLDPYSANANAIDLQSDGKIILSGNAKNDSEEPFIVVRYLQNGEIDTEFGDEGIFHFIISEFRDNANDIAINQTDEIFLTGHTYDQNFDRKGFLLKLNKDGIIDSTFAQNGIWISESSNTSEIFREIIIQEDGKILIAGKTDIIGQSTKSTVIRFDTDGNLDSHFGDNGIASVEVPQNFNPSFGKLNSRNEIITGGFILDNNTNTLLVKFLQNGELDTSFGSNGVMIEYSNWDEIAQNIAIQDDDKILVASGLTTNTGRDFSVTRFNNDGSLDQSFGINGKVQTDFSQTSNISNSVVIQEDGKIILSGFVGIRPNHNYAIARYDSHGTIDPTFGDAGRVVTDFGFDDNSYMSILQPDGKLICAGNSNINDDFSKFTMARYLTHMETSIDNLPQNFTSVSLFPNPTLGSYTISFELKSSSYISINILTIGGQLVQSVINDQIFQVGLNTINVVTNQNINPGIYLTKIQTEEGDIYKKLIIAK